MEKLLADPATLYIDVRTPGEVATPPTLPPELPCLNIPCTAADASSLAAAASASELPGDRGAPILVFCKAGSRAAKAREVLLGLGFRNVVNGGGIGDVLSGLADAAAKKGEVVKLHAGAADLVFEC